MASTCWVGRLLRMRRSMRRSTCSIRATGLMAWARSRRRRCAGPAPHIHPGVAVMSAIARSGSSRLLRAPGRTRTCRATRCPPRARQSGVLQAVRGLRLPTWRSRPRIPSVRAPRRGSRGPGSSSTTRMRPCRCGDGVAPVTPEESSLTSAAMLPFFGLPSVERPLLLLSPTVAMSTVWRCICRVRRDALNRVALSWTSPRLRELADGPSEDARAADGSF